MEQSENIASDELEVYLLDSSSPRSTLNKMRSLVAESPLSLQKISDRLKIPEKDILNAYIVGSRLWGTATRSSDYDIILVLSKAQKDHYTLHNTDIDASIVSEKEFRQRIADHAVYELVCCNIPQEFCLKKTLVVPHAIQPSILLKSVREETDRDWRLAQTFMEKGHLERAKKVIIHAYRLVLLAIQLAQSGRIENFSCALCYEGIRNIRASSWAELNRITRSQFDKHLQVLKGIADSKPKN